MLKCTPCRRMYVGVPDGSRESHLWRIHRVVFWKRQECMKAPTLVRRAVWPQHSIPTRKGSPRRSDPPSIPPWVFRDLLVLSSSLRAAMEEDITSLFVRRRRCSLPRDNCNELKPDQGRPKSALLDGPITYLLRRCWSRHLQNWYKLYT